MTDRRIRNLVMLGVLATWMGYMGFCMGVLGEQPEKWTWGIAPGIYAALYRPGLGKSRQNEGAGGDDDEPDERPVRRQRRARAGDE